MKPSDTTVTLPTAPATTARPLGRVAYADRGGRTGRTMLMPQVSVVVATFDRPGEIAAAADRILAQHDVELELIVVDDGSPTPIDPQLAGAPEGRVQVLRQSNAGPSAARNEGARHARAPLLVFVDDDDVPDEGWLAQLVAPLAEPRCGLARCFAKGVHHLSFVPGTFAVRATVFDAIGGYDEHLREAEGADLGFRLLEACAEQHLDVVVVEHALIDRPKSASRSLARTPLRYDAARYIVDKHGRKLPSRTRSRFLAIAGVSAARMGRWVDARASFIDAIKARPVVARNYFRL